MKQFIRIVSIVIIVLCIFIGAYTVYFYSTDNSDLGVRMVCLLYEYEDFNELDARQEQIESLCTQDVFEQLSLNNSDHFKGTYGRTQNFPTSVKVVFLRPGLVVYALDNYLVYPSDLWCFEYTITGGKFSEVREYKLVGKVTDDKGGLFNVGEDT